MAWPEVPLHFARTLGWTASAGVMWDGECGGGGLHSTREEMNRGEGEMPDGALNGFVDLVWSPATTCERCGAELGSASQRCFGSGGDIYDTPTGKLEPGSVVWHSSDPPDHCFFGWTNCDGRHVAVMLPNMHQWIVDQRASNCSMPDDRVHRCWVRTGDPEHPETLDVSKGGLTCDAGAGSILSSDYHGFLRNGVLVPC